MLKTWGVFLSNTLSPYSLSPLSSWMWMRWHNTFLPKSSIISGVIPFFPPCLAQGLLFVCCFCTANCSHASGFSFLRFPSLHRRTEITDAERSNFLCVSGERVSQKYFLYGYRESVSKTSPFRPRFKFQIVIIVHITQNSSFHFA